MMGLELLATICERRGLAVRIDLIGPTGHNARSEPIAPHGSLRVRVITLQDEVVLGRCQSDPGKESIDELSELCVIGLAARGVLP